MKWSVLYVVNDVVEVLPMLPPNLKLPCGFPDLVNLNICRILSIFTALSI